MATGDNGQQSGEMTRRRGTWIGIGPAGEFPPLHVDPSFGVAIGQTNEANINKDDNADGAACPRMFCSSHKCAVSGKRNPLESTASHGLSPVEFDSIENVQQTASPHSQRRLCQSHSSPRTSCIARSRRCQIPSGSHHKDIPV